MYPPVFTLANASASVKAVFGTNPLRIYPFGEAPAKGTPAYALPYAVWQSISILPENYLSDVPDGDFMSPQVDVYAETPTAARNAAQVLRDLYQQHGYVTAMREWPREADTNLFRYQLDIEFFQER